MNKNRLDSLGYKVGYILGIVCLLCLSAVIMGITVKFLFWLF